MNKILNRRFLYLKTSRLAQVLAPIEIVDKFVEQSRYLAISTDSVIILKNKSQEDYWVGREVIGHDPSLKETLDLSVIDLAPADCHVQMYNVPDYKQLEEVITEGFLRFNCQSCRVLTTSFLEFECYFY
ncbi:MAG: hypothetical protein HON90_07825 [Halobacteriovoraceae bacterium]|jgi:hypothetical protein|nr:hypothetical protein [Halobacteriovoraceae bacterium]